jgi:hypothetical protein
MNEVMHESMHESKLQMYAVESDPAPAPRRLGEGEPQWKRRNREPKVHGFNLRLSKSQLELLKAAADLHEISQQKFVERELWPLMEEKYGHLLE